MIVFIATVSLLASVVQEGNCDEVCQTPACVNTGTMRAIVSRAVGPSIATWIMYCVMIAAARVTESMNVDPCDDFYEFACRGWIMKNPIPPNEHTIDTLGLIRKDIELKLHKILDSPDNDQDGKPIKLARALYRTCMDVDSINKLNSKPLYDTMSKLGLPHEPPSDEKAKVLDILKIAGLASRLYKLLQTSPGINNLDILLRQPILFRQVLLAQSRIVKSLFVIGGAGNKSEEYTTELMGFMTKIANIMGTPAERVSENYTGSVVTIDELQEITDPHGDTWNWMKYFEAIFEQTDITVDPKTDTVLLNDVSYSKNLILLLKETPPGTIARYVWWEIILTYWVTVHQAFSKSPRWQVCIKIVNERFEAAVTAAYVEKHFDVQYKKKAMEMWADVNSSLDEMIDELDWMDAETKAHAHVKLHAVRPAIGYPEWITNSEELNKYYEPFEVYEGRLFDTYTQYQLIWGKRLLNSWKQIPDKNQWAIAGTAVNAIYVPTQNAVAIPAGILHLPLYGNGVESLNYGALGMATGGQLVQAIDNIGGKTDENGNDRQWWSDATLKPYLEKIGCIVKQYTDLMITHQGHNFKLNGIQIQRGSIANIAGLKIAFRAYKKFKARSDPQQVLPALDKYTDEQLFFIGFAQTFCGSETAVGLNKFIQVSKNPPNRYRVIGTLQNSDEFAKAWNCSHNSPMNPKKTCTTIW